MNAIDIIEMNASDRELEEGEEFRGGIIYCTNCGTPRETIIEHPFTHQMRKVRCICRCQQEEKEREEAEARTADAKRRAEKARADCFGESGYAQYVFAEDDGKNAENSRRARNYAEHFETFAEKGQGLLMIGGTGTGKTFHSACIANALIDKGYEVVMASVPAMISQMQRNAYAKADPMAYAVSCDLLILDDLGAERSTEYAQEQVYAIIDGRYSRRKPMIVSTNLTPRQLGAPETVTLQRTYGRILERCFPIRYSGEDRRRASNMSDIRALLDM